VTDGSSVERAFADVVSGLGALDVMINVAGGDTYHGTFEETTDEVWVRMIELNLLGVVRCCRAAIPHLRRTAKSPAIVNRRLGQRPRRFGQPTLLVPKAGIGALTINLAAGLAADGIRVNTVAPATIRTRNWEGQEGGADRIHHLYPLGRVGEPEDVAAAVAFLASSYAAWITGHTLHIDGGLMQVPERPSPAVRGTHSLWRQDGCGGVPVDPNYHQQLNCRPRRRGADVRPPTRPEPACATRR
jgi:meso-butanediol dehydrogenase / (S,S)-butanediol dehydrogenase / diacetyl reductase